MSMVYLPPDIQLELDTAQEALKNGNEGKARVCARRAIARAFEKSDLNPYPDHPLSAMEVLKILSQIDNIPPVIKSAVRRLSASVGDRSNEISTLPVEDALSIIEFILKGK
ncbi:MAG: hypothetical protein ACP5MI_09315 [Candidatus Kryptoniota bacterium]